MRCFPLFLGTDAEKLIADQYLDALRPPKPPSPKRPQPERAPEEWEKDKQELRELEYHKYTIRTKDFPPYFQTEEGEILLNFYQYSSKMFIQLQPEATLWRQSKNSNSEEFFSSVSL